ncbi:MAG TPA: hypothetical protein ENH15_00775 [Actinobacteria bacterium]|nr:hypothetical protein [Actinomycetota bacterium]
MGFCIDFLMDSTAAIEQVRKVDESYLVVPVGQYARLNPALGALVGRRPEYAPWIPASVCIITADTVTVGDRTVTDDDPEKRPMVGFWGIAAKPADEPYADSVMAVPVMFTNDRDVTKSSSLGKLKLDKVKEDRGDSQDTPGDRFYHVRVKKADIHWTGHMAGTPAPAEPRRWTLMFKGHRSSFWMADFRLEPGEQQFVVGSLRIEGKDDLAQALKGSPIRMQGPAFWGGVGRVAFFQK